MMIDRCNILIVGGGLAGVALGSWLSDCNRRVWVLDHESQVPAPTPGRAFAPWNPARPVDEKVGRLSSAAASLWQEKPGVMRPKGMLHIFDSASLAEAGELWSRGIGMAMGVEQLDP